MKFEDYLAEELPFKAWLDAYIDPDKVKTVFEVGACEAEDTIKLSRAFPKASIYAFEPLPKNVALSRKHIKKYGAERIELFPLALSDKTGQATFFVSSGQPTDAPKDPGWNYGNKSSSLLQPNRNSKVNKWLKFNEKINVKTKRLDVFCKQKAISEIDFLYLDVQGAELMVLEGAGKMLGHIKAIWLEVEAVELYNGQPLKSRVEKFMKKAGFKQVMSTVSGVSGDQLYINVRQIAEVLNDEKHHPEQRLQSINRVVKYAEKVWDHTYLTDPQRHQMEKKIEQINIKWNELTNKLSRRPSVSVVMSMYNGEKYLRRAVNSILEQSYKDFEFIIIDDGSIDDLVKVIRGFDDPRIRLIHQINHGLNYSLNKGIRLARAQLIARMDTDDISLPSRFEKQTNLLASQPEVGLVSTFFTYMNEGTEAKSITFAFPFKSLDVKRSFYMVNPIAHGSAMFRKSIWKAVGGFNPDYQPPDDYHLWTEIAEVADIAIIPESLYLYRINPIGMTATMAGLEEKAAIIRAEYWKKGYKAKGTLAILKDAKYYKELDNPHAQIIYEQYIAQQLHIARYLITRQILKPAIKMTIAVILLDRKQTRLVLSLGKHFIKRILHRPPLVG